MSDFNHVGKLNLEDVSQGIEQVDVVLEVRSPVRHEESESLRRIDFVGLFCLVDQVIQHDCEARRDLPAHHDHNVDQMDHLLLVMPHRWSCPVVKEW